MSPKAGESLRDAHARATRRLILDRARRRFAAHGFDRTSLDRIAAAAGVTKGAIYHHFRGKEQLFEEVYTELAAEMSARVARAMADPGAPPPARAIGALEAFLDCADDPEIRSILFRDGPAVLAGRCRTIDRDHFLGLLIDLVGSLLGDPDPREAAILGQLILSLLIEASQLLAGSEDPIRARAEVRSALLKILGGIGPS